MMGAARCRLLEWDSEFFGQRIARVESARMDAALLDEVGAFARSEAIDCLYFLVDAADSASIRSAESGGFRCVDVRVTRERTLDPAGHVMPAGVETVREDDLAALRAVARTSHAASRFYHDPHFSRERCGALYETWITKVCLETPDNVLVVRREGSAVGYLACELNSAILGTVGLVAVAERERGRQLGADLVQASLAWFARNELGRVRVVSQARNVAAARLYERFGFRTTRVESWYHLWPGRGEGG